ncbi:MAG TPA: flagellar motor protein [Spongiibacteraceae bacterium]|nr:flagellar motor protein [Spongiibacteraceae bacterium]
MDVLSLVGIAIGLIAIIGGNWLEGGHLGALLNLPAFMIVVGGTFGAATLQTPLSTLRLAFRNISYVFSPPALDFKAGVGKIVRWAMAARKEGLLGLESVADTERDLFARKALQLLVDGSEPDAIRGVMELESDLREQRDIDAAKFFESMGGYSPTIGIIGAVLGLIHVMGNLADPSKLGPGIATAFVATIYGVAIANLFLLPVANKLRGHARLESHYREMLIEGVISIAEGENPRSIELKLNGFVES